MTNRRRLVPVLITAALAACTPPGSLPANTTPPPPWPRPADTAARVQAAGLTLLATEGTTYHIHAHLDVFYDATPVTVPAAIGIDTGPPGGISALHTHDETGTIHIESPEKKDFTLGQFFTEWGVPLAGAQAFANGKAVASAAGLVLQDLQHVTVVFGRPPAAIPNTSPAPPR